MSLSHYPPQPPPLHTAYVRLQSSSAQSRFISISCGPQWLMQIHCAAAAREEGGIQSLDVKLN